MKKLALFTLIPALALALTACGGSSAASKPSYTPPVSHVVKYEAYQTITDAFTRKYLKSSDQRISVTLTTPTGIEQHDFAQQMTNKAGYNYATYKFNTGSPVSLSVQNVGNKGNVTCRISVDDVVVSENTSGAQYGIASCSGIAN